jgi:replicative DNA helicase
MLPEIFNHVEALSKMAGHKVKSGLVDLDRDTGGFGPGELTIIAGRPAMGKSTLADTIIRYNGIILRHPVAVFSLEMSRILCGARMLFAEASLSYHTARQGLLPKREFDELGTASELLMTAPIWIDDSPDLTTTHIITKCNYIKAQTGISLIVVDYLQLMGSLSKGESRQEQISKISRGLKGISKIFDCPVIALSQLSREVEKRSPPIPMMSDLRESGAIEQDADAVLMLYRDDYYNGESKNPGITDIIIGKQRNGPVGTVSTKFDGKAMRFLNLVKENEPERIVNERDYGPF